MKKLESMKHALLYKDKQNSFIYGNKGSVRVRKCVYFLTVLMNHMQLIIDVSSAPSLPRLHCRGKVSGSTTMLLSLNLALMSFTSLCNEV